MNPTTMLGRPLEEAGINGIIEDLLLYRLQKGLAIDAPTGYTPEEIEAAKTRLRARRIWPF